MLTFGNDTTLLMYLLALRLASITGKDCVGLGKIHQSWNFLHFFQNVPRESFFYGVAKIRKSALSF